MNNELLVILLSALLVLMTGVVFYSKSRVEKNNIKDSPKDEGMFFKRYVPPSQHQLELDRQESIERTHGKLQRLKWGASGLLILVFVMGLVVSIFSNKNRVDSIVNIDEKSLESFISKPVAEGVNQFESLPVLRDELASLESLGLVLVSNQDASMDDSLRNLRDDSQRVWEKFAHDKNVELVSCTWDQLRKCQKSHKNWIFVILPDFWQHKKIASLLKSGASILLYDAPLQVLSEYTTGEFSLYGLNFKRSLSLGDINSKLALVGDRELSLGFNAGVVLDIKRNSSFYKVTSEYPQALAVDLENNEKGDLITRLYAKSVKKGRLVWMDFSPSHAEGMLSVEQKSIDGVLASVFRYLGKEPYSGIASWPEGKRFASLLKEDEDTVDGFAYADLVYKKDAYFATAKGISSWRKFRADLMIGNITDYGNGLEVYKPVMLKVGSDGKVSSHDYSSLDMATR